MRRRSVQVSSRFLCLRAVSPTADFLITVVLAQPLFATSGELSVFVFEGRTAAFLSQSNESVSRLCARQTKAHVVFFCSIVELLLFFRTEVVLASGVEINRLWTDITCCRLCSPLARRRSAALPFPSSRCARDLTGSLKGLLT